jgi:hypothetical protein
MLLWENSALKQKTLYSSMAYYVYVLLYNAEKQVFTCYRFATFVIKQR